MIAATAHTIAPRPERAQARFSVIYDGQCEICQAYVSWLKVFDKKRVTACLPVDERVLRDFDLRADDCLRELHVVTDSGKIIRGWDAIARLARLSPWTWPISTVFAVPPFVWLGRVGYRFIARNRYVLSKCRGGACSVAQPEQVRQRSSLFAFWSCYIFGLITRLPFVLGAGTRELCDNVHYWVRTRAKRIDLLGGKLSLMFLGGVPSALVPLLFGERFTAVVYDGLLIDPGSPRMRRVLANHLRRYRRKISAVVATHHHEEHTGNLGWAARRLNVPLYTSAATAKELRSPKPTPRVRSWIIGRLESLPEDVVLLADRIMTNSTELEVLPAPGHSDDHVVLYDPREKLLLAGDAFMGSYFSVPNPDVDSVRWIVTLEALLQREITTLVEGHGHIHTIRPDIPDIPGVVIREDPMQALREKLEYLKWVREQVKTGLSEGLPLGAVEATCFPWGRRSSWESFVHDSFVRLASLNHFSRAELVRSFVRHDDSAILPTVYRARFYRRHSSKL